MKKNDVVRIKGEPKGSINEFARIAEIYPDGLILITNLNMPFSGTLSKVVPPSFIESLESDE